MNPETFTGWVHEFEAAARRRQVDGEPDWRLGADLHRTVVRSLQRFQVGEEGDGANLIAKADIAGDPGYSAAVAMFVAEEQNHARMLAALLAAADASTISNHWTDTAFVRLRRAMGLRLELMVLMVAEVIALRYYRAVRDGSGDALATAVAGRILSDEQRHVPFHCQRLRVSFAALPPAVCRVLAAGWQLLLCCVAVTVAVDHGSALRRLGVTRTAFVADVVGLFRSALGDVLGARRMPLTRC